MQGTTTLSWATEVLYEPAVSLFHNKIACYRRFGRIFCLLFLHRDGCSMLIFHAGNSL